MEAVSYHSQTDKLTVNGLMLMKRGRMTTYVDYLASHLPWIRGNRHRHGNVNEAKENKAWLMSALR